MREIKFRGKRLDNGEWIYGDLITDGVDFHIHCKDQRCHFNKDDCKQTLLKSYKVNPKTVGQYIGLKDKNSRGIYKGDVVDLELASTLEIIKGEIVQDDSGDWLIYKGSGNYVSVYHNRDKIKVIGNIYKNPELLKQY